MDHLLQEKLQNLARLGSSIEETRKCKICGHKSYLFNIVDFNKWCSERPYTFGHSGIQVNYFRCDRCQFVFTDFMDNWTSGDIAKYIYNDDYILVDPGYKEVRPFDQAKAMAKLLDGCQSLRILDYGSGSGKFARHMEEFGFARVTNYDPFSCPERPEGQFDLITAFEVVEHSPNPLQTFREMTNFMAPNGALLVGQTVQPANIDEVKGAWWYIAPRNGHVSTYADYTFFVIARTLNLFYRRKYRLGGNFVFTRGSLPPVLETAMARIGPNFSVCILAAPEGDAAAPGQWHKLEKWHGEAWFRWTAHDQITWHGCILEKGINRIEAQFVMEVVEGFAQRCRLTIDGRELPTKVEGNSIVAEASFPVGGAYAVSLQTAPTVSPKDIGRSSDPRKLGLAVPVRNSATTETG